VAGELAPAGRQAATGPSRLGVAVATAGAAGVVTLIALRGHTFASALARALHANWGVVAACALLEMASLGGYVLLLHRVVSGASPRLRLRHSYDITLAGTAATRLLPTAGLGGAAVTVWALRSRGVDPRELAERLIAFLLLLYSVYMGALALCGGAVATGLLSVPGGRGIGLVALAVGLAVPLLVLGLAAAPKLLTQVARAGSRSPGRLASLADRAERYSPVLRSGLLRSLGELRRPHPALLGALAWWGFDMAVLFALLHAFGASPGITTVVLAYFLGTLFNVVPLPGSLSGGLAGMLVALGLAAAPALAAVLAYRAVAVWLPAAAGALSLARLRTSIAA
jgi:uncharacterized membrane protein YbhN (UPF0104 family)